MNKEYIIWDVTHKHYLCSTENIVDALKIIAALRLTEDDLISYNLITNNFETLMRFGGNKNERISRSDIDSDLSDIWNRK